MIALQKISDYVVRLLSGGFEGELRIYFKPGKITHVREIRDISEL